eukprot:7384460-Prymnesium_polylepis.6
MQDRAQRQWHGEPMRGSLLRSVQRPCAHDSSCSSSATFNSSTFITPPRSLYVILSMLSTRASPEEPNLAFDAKLFAVEFNARVLAAPPADSRALVDDILKQVTGRLGEARVTSFT